MVEAFKKFKENNIYHNISLTLVGGMNDDLSKMINKKIRI